MTVAPAFLILSEDGSDSAVLTLASLSRTMCKLVVPALRTNLLLFEPPDHRLRGALSGNRWKSRQLIDQHARTDLLRTIATHLLRDNAYVVFHYDGDVPYSRRDECPHDALFAEQITKPVRELLRGHIGSDPALRLLSRLIVFKPHYCIESWTYQNYGFLRRLANGADMATITAWEATPGIIEEVERPWALISVGKAANRQLAEHGYPYEQVFAVGRSYAEAVWRLLEADGLPDALQRTCV